MSNDGVLDFTVANREVFIKSPNATSTLRITHNVVVVGGTVGEASNAFPCSMHDRRLRRGHSSLGLPVAVDFVVQLAGRLCPHPLPLIWSLLIKTHGHVWTVDAHNSVRVLFLDEV